MLLIYSDCFFDLAITDFLGVLMSCLNDFTFESSSSKFFFTEDSISSFSIIFVKKYLSIKNLIASLKTSILSFFPLQVIELPLKKDACIC